MRSGCIDVQLPLNDNDTSPGDLVPKLNDHIIKPPLALGGHPVVLCLELLLRGLSHPRQRRQAVEVALGIVVSLERAHRVAGGSGVVDGLADVGGVEEGLLCGHRGERGVGVVGSGGTSVALLRQLRLAKGKLIWEGRH